MPQLPEPVWRRRIDSEYQQLLSQNERFSVSADRLSYEFTIAGPGLICNVDGTVIRADEHKVRLTLNRNYPYPGGFELVWLSPIFHPNIRNDGKVCIQLVNEWSAGQTLANIVNALRQLLENPNPDSPLNTDAARYFIEHPNALALAAAPKAEVKKPKIILQK